MKKTIEEKIEMTAGEREFIDRFVADYCRPHHVVMAERLAAFVAERRMAFVDGAAADFALAAGPRSASAPAAEAPVSPDEEVRFAFASDGTVDDADAWRAELRVPPKATAETMLTIVVRDCSRSPAARCRSRTAPRRCLSGCSSLEYRIPRSGFAVRADSRSPAACCSSDLL